MKAARKAATMAAARAEVAALAGAPGAAAADPWMIERRITRPAAPGFAAGWFYPAHALDDRCARLRLRCWPAKQPAGVPDLAACGVLARERGVVAPSAWLASGRGVEAPYMAHPRDAVAVILAARALRRLLAEPVP